MHNQAEQQNPLLRDVWLIPFREIRAEHIVPAVDSAIAWAEEAVAAIVADGQERTYDTVLGAFDRMETRIDRIFGICAHLQSSVSSSDIREAYQQALPRFVEFSNGLRTRQDLWEVVRDYASSDEAKQLDPVRARRLAELVDDFRRHGAELDATGRERLQSMMTELAELSNRFSEHVLDDTAKFSLHLTDEGDLAGLPESSVAAARRAAEERGLDGWVITLQQPSAMPFLQYSERRELRRTVQQAYANRASQGELDNEPVIRRILKLRRDVAHLLGYPDFADYRLEQNMVGSGGNAISFLDDLYGRTLPYWQREMDTLADFARTELGIDELEAWDLSWASEKLRRSTLDFDSEELRPYFSHDRVMAGLFEIANRLFGVTVEEAANDQVWHEDVQFYEIRDGDGTHLASFYADWFPREGKRAGAWMNSFVTGGPREDGGFDPHLGLIMGNLTPPEAGKAARFTHREVQTIFHEFGHLLHHCLSRVGVRALGGTQVKWDWVEVPSQIMENWTVEPEALALFARHSETGEPLPDELLAKLKAASTFMGGNLQMRQLSFGSLDLALHTTYDPEGEEGPVAFGNRLRRRFVARPEHADDAFICGFTHLFSGAYAAAYYSYKWSEVLEADAFSRFRDEGVFNPETGRAFRRAILETGDSADPNELYERFMGRGPSVDALISRNLGPLPTD